MQVGNEEARYPFGGRTVLRSSSQPQERSSRRDVASNPGHNLFVPRNRHCGIGGSGIDKSDDHRAKRGHTIREDAVCGAPVVQTTPFQHYDAGICCGHVYGEFFSVVIGFQRRYRSLRRPCLIYARYGGSLYLRSFYVLNRTIHPEFEIGTIIY